MMSGTNKPPAPRTTSPVRGRQAAFSHSNGRKTTVEDPYGDSQTRASSLSRSADNPFVTFDGNFTTPSTPWSGSSPESNPGSVSTSESDPGPEQEVSTLDRNRGQPQFRNLFELDSNKPATSEAVYGENGSHEVSAEVVACDGDGDQPAIRRRPVSPLLQPRRVAMERVGARSTVNSSGNLKSVSFNDFPQSEWFGTSGPGHRSGVQEQGREGLRFTERLNEVKSSSRKYEPWPMFENKKRCWESLEKICPWKEGHESVFREYIGQCWRKAENYFKHGSRLSQVYEFRDVPKRRLNPKAKGKARGRNSAAVQLQPGIVIKPRRESMLMGGNEHELADRKLPKRVRWEPENGNWSSSTIAPRCSQGRDDNGATVPVGYSERSEPKQFQGQDFDPVLFSPTTQLQKPSKSARWSPRKL